jgi:hypothetical protein
MRLVRPCTPRLNRVPRSAWTLSNRYPAEMNFKTCLSLLALPTAFGCMVIQDEVKDDERHHVVVQEPGNGMINRVETNFDDDSSSIIITSENKGDGFYNKKETVHFAEGLDPQMMAEFKHFIEEVVDSFKQQGGHEITFEEDEAE